MRVEVIHILVESSVGSDYRDQFSAWTVSLHARGRGGRKNLSKFSLNLKYVNLPNLFKHLSGNYYRVPSYVLSMGGSIASGHQRGTSAERFAAKSDLSIALLIRTTDNLYTAMLLTVASVRDIPSCGVYSITSEMGNHIGACTHARYIHNHALRLRG